MKFEWHPAKSEGNRAARGFGFDLAAMIFAGPTLEWCDVRQSYGEVRVAALGQVEGIGLFVVYTDRHDVRRMVSARLANRKERKLWQEVFG